MTKRNPNLTPEELSEKRRIAGEKGGQATRRRWDELNARRLSEAASKGGQATKARWERIMAERRAQALDITPLP